MKTDQQTLVQDAEDYLTDALKDKFKQEYAQRKATILRNEKTLEKMREELSDYVKEFFNNPASVHKNGDYL